MQASSIQERSSGFYLQELRRHRGCAAFLAIVALGLAFDAVRRDVVKWTGLYAIAIGLAVLVIDRTLRPKPRSVDPLPVRAPMVEIALLCANTLVAFAFLWLHFWAGFQPDSASGRLLFFGVGLGALFNLFLFLVFLGLAYRPSEIGVRTNGLGIALLVVVVFGALAVAFAPDRIATSLRADRTTLFLTGPLAGLSEEFFRFTWQTRVGAWRANAAVGWIVASCLWAACHGPVFWTGTGSAFHAAVGVVQILPFGLLLGYLSHRTESFLPAALVHATNIWGLHNLG